MERNTILVVGGYGQVGKIICRRLVHDFPGNVIAAERNLEKAQAFSTEMNETVLPMMLDIHQFDKSDPQLNSVALCLMCIDQDDTELAAYCIKHHIHYLNISPSYESLSRVKTLYDKVPENESTFVLGVGLAPGLSNLLVKQCMEDFDEILSTDLYLMLGIGESHGYDGVKWLVSNLNKSFSVKINGSEQLVSSFTDGKKRMFNRAIGTRTAYRFDLADQHILPTTLGIETVSSRFFYDSSFSTIALAFLKRLGIFHLLKIKGVRNLFIKFLVAALNIFQKLKIGSDQYIVKVETKGVKQGEIRNYETYIYGRDNTTITGETAAIVAAKIMENKSPIGVFYMEQFIHLDEILPKLRQNVSFDLHSTSRQAFSLMNE
ncbi:saccharopine dehydrogenase NADP-binding domain-containing protein [Bacillus sp. JCM 19041]|uniref:saccharopine dehydrogenase NADP-binding domain-containing protein n=1 Tax=Bacillus sp. JCM 19041 TaxID=1460637 RepID=UPI0006CF32AE